MHTALIGLGSNLGDRKATLQAASQRLQALVGVEQVQISSIYETQSLGGPADQPPYLNAALQLRTSLAPEQLFQEMQRIELAAGRIRQTHWGARTLDLDLLLFDEVVRNADPLVLPHRYLPFRRFVLEPAVEIAGEMQHPTLGWSVRQCYEHLLHAPPRFEIWSVAEEPARTLLAACRSLYPQLECDLRCWEHRDLVAWEVASPPKARFVLEVNRDTLGWEIVTGFVEMMVLIESLPRVPQLLLSMEENLAQCEVLAAVRALQQNHKTS